MTPDECHFESNESNVGGSLAGAQKTRATSTEESGDSVGDDDDGLFASLPLLLSPCSVALKLPHSSTRDFDRKMASRKAAVESAGDNERPSKRPRLLDDNPTNTVAPTPSLDYINSDCLLHILTFLPTEDLNAIAICGRRYQKARAHESLDQTRTGTIVISQQQTISSFFNMIATNSWGESFQGNRTHLKIRGVERLSRGEAAREDLIQHGVACRFSGVTTLELAGNFSETGFSALRCLCHAFQNLVEADMSSLTGGGHPWFFCKSFCLHCPNLGRFVWSGYEGDRSLELDGSNFLRARNLTSIVMDDSHFARGWQLDRDDGAYMFQYCRSLQRLSIKNATYRDANRVRRPVSQDMLIKIVRHHPTLQWLRSDLSAENVATLQQERPDITFVSK